MTAIHKSTSSVSYVTIISIWLKWYFHLDIVGTRFLLLGGSYGCGGTGSLYFSLPSPLLKSNSTKSLMNFLWDSTVESTTQSSELYLETNKPKCGLHSQRSTSKLFREVDNVTNSFGFRKMRWRRSNILFTFVFLSNLNYWEIRFFSLPYSQLLWMFLALSWKILFPKMISIFFTWIHPTFEWEW